MKKVILITGASSGIGFTTAKSLAKQGHKVYGAARRVEKMEELKQYGVTPIKMDVTSEESVNARRPKTRYLIGFMAKPMVWLHTILPNRWLDYIVKHAS